MQQTQWSGRISFIFATTASAVGLGNIWRFPYLVGENGGSAFVLIYLLAVLLLGLPLLVGEILIGRHGRGSPVSAMTDLIRKHQANRHWVWIGRLSVLSALLVLSYYLVISGWVLDFLIRSLGGQFQSVGHGGAQSVFLTLRESHGECIVATSGVVLSMIGVLLFDLKAGLERAVLILFPAFLILLLGLLGFAAAHGDMAHALSFLFHPDFSRVHTSTYLEALGQAFFSLNIGLAITMMFSAYLPKQIPLLSSAICITVADTLIALLSGLIIFPIVFANGLEPSSGPSLIFRTLPVAFSSMPGGYWVGSLFFLLLFFAAFTSVIALLEPCLVWCMERFKLSRPRAVFLSGGVCWLMSFGTIYSFHEARWMIGSKSIFEWIDWLTANIMIPITGIGIALFLGWVMRRQLVTESLNWQPTGLLFRFWQLLLRVIAPLCILFILIHAVWG